MSLNELNIASVSTLRRLLYFEHPLAMYQSTTPNIGMMLEATYLTSHTKREPQYMNTKSSQIMAARFYGETSRPKL